MSALGKSAALTLVAMLVTWMLLVWLAPSNAAMAPATCTTTHCFCENPRLGLAMVQPANSWSSFGYVLLGLFLIFEAKGRAVATAFPVEAAITYGVGAITVGIGSVFLHATLTLWGQFADVLGMYLLGGFQLVYALTKVANLKRIAAVGLYVAVCAALVAVLIIAPEVRRWLFFVVLVAALVIEIAFARPRREGVILRYLLAGILAKAVAFTFWTLDQKLILCAPDSMMQGHAVWHLLGAVALFMTSRYYRSELLVR